MKGWARRREKGRRTGLHFLPCAPNESPSLQTKEGDTKINGRPPLPAPARLSQRPAQRRRGGTILSTPLKAELHCHCLAETFTTLSLHGGKHKYILAKTEKFFTTVFITRGGSGDPRVQSRASSRHFSPTTGKMRPIV